MPRGKAIRNRNGYGTVVRLSGSRRQPYEVRVNTKMDECYYPVYDVLGRYATREEALIALAEYNKNPYDIGKSKITFHELYDAFFKDKYELSGKVFSQSSKDCTRAAYNHMEPLHKRIYKDLRANDFKLVFNLAKNGRPISHAMQEHMKSLLVQMDKFALQNDIINKGYAAYVSITVEEDDEPGVPFTHDELATLWQHQDDSWADAALIYIYSGWRISELNNMPIEDIDLSNWTFRGGVKTAAGKDRIVPIHSAIRGMVAKRIADNGARLFVENGKAISNLTLTRHFKNALAAAGITTYHTIHDCRHTFASLLDTAGANPICIDRLIGHASKSITSKTYTHKDIEELRAAVELIKAPVH